MAYLEDSAETNLITKTQMTRAREVDFVQRFTHNALNKLIEENQASIDSLKEILLKKVIRE